MTNNSARLSDLATYINGYAFKPTDWGNRGIEFCNHVDKSKHFSELKVAA